MIHTNRLEFIKDKGTIKKYNYTLRLCLLLALFILLWVVSGILHSGLVWHIVINLMALLVIFQYKIFDKKMIVTGTFLGVLCMPSHLFMGVTIILPYIAATMIFKNSKNKIFLYQNGKKNNFIITIVLIFIIGGILGGINLFLAKGGRYFNPSFQWKWIFDALRAGVMEEVFFRFFFFAMCVYVTNDHPLSRLQNLLCYGVMVIPHVLIHFSFETFKMVNIIVLTLLFGLPFALMQRKSNLTSAMGAHTLVDVIRFCMVGR